MFIYARLSSVFRKESNTEIISAITKEFSIYKTNYTKITHDIECLNIISSSNDYNLNYNSHPGDFFIFHGQITKYNLISIGNINNFMKIHEIGSIRCKNQEYFIFYYSYRYIENKDGGTVGLVNLCNYSGELLKSYQEKGYEIYQQGCPPSKNSGWIYFIDLNWAIVSTFNKE